MPAVAIAAARIVRRAADIIRLRRPHAAMAPHDQYTGGSLGWRLKLENCLFSQPPLFDAPAPGEPVRISGWNLTRKN